MRVSMNETRIMGSGAYGEQRQAPQAEKGALHQPLDGRRVILGPAEVAAFRAQLAQVRAEAAARLNTAQNVYAGPDLGETMLPGTREYPQRIQETSDVLADMRRQRSVESTPNTLPQAADAALQRKFNEGHVIVPGTPEGDRARQLRDQRDAQPTQQTGGIVSRLRRLFR